MAQEVGDTGPAGGGLLCSVRRRNKEARLGGPNGWAGWLLGRLGRNLKETSFQNKN
jgi:hypothetical protein